MNLKEKDFEMRKLYLFTQHMTAQRVFIAANNKYSCIELMQDKILSCSKDRIELIGKFYGAKYKSLDKPTILKGF